MRDPVDFERTGSASRGSNFESRVLRKPLHLQELNHWEPGSIIARRGEVLGGGLGGADREAFFAFGCRFRVQLESVTPRFLDEAGGGFGVRVFPEQSTCGPTQITQSRIFSLKRDVIRPVAWEKGLKARPVLSGFSKTNLPVISSLRLFWRCNFIHDERSSDEAQHPCDHGR